MALTSDDSTPASLTSASAMALEGSNNDTVAVRFDDDMFASDVTNVANWAVESPVGTMVDPMNASVVYDAPTRTVLVEGRPDRIEEISTLIARVEDSAAIRRTQAAENEALRLSNSRAEIEDQMYRKALESEVKVIPLRFATAYKLADGTTTTDFPAFDLESVVPQFEELPGFDEDITGVREFEALPANARRYIESIEEHTGLRVAKVSVGPGRDQVIRRD